MQKINPSGAGVLLLCLFVTVFPCNNFLLLDSSNVLTLETQLHLAQVSFSCAFMLLPFNAGNFTLPDSSNVLTPETFQQNYRLIPAPISISFG
jgi:hypothetical protein